MQANANSWLLTTGKRFLHEFPNARNIYPEIAITVTQGVQQTNIYSLTNGKLSWTFHLTALEHATCIYRVECRMHYGNSGRKKNGKYDKTKVHKCGCSACYVLHSVFHIKALLFPFFCIWPIYCNKTTFYIARKKRLPYDMHHTFEFPFFSLYHIFFHSLFPILFVSFITFAILWNDAFFIPVFSFATCEINLFCHFKKNSVVEIRSAFICWSHIYAVCLFNE